MPQVPPSAPDHFRGHIARSRTFSGPVSFLNPTTRYVTFPKGPATGPPPRASTAPVSGESAAGRDGGGAFRVWRSRDNRKGRHAVTVSPEYAARAGAACPPPTNSLRETLRGLAKMVMRYPVWDVSYDVATIFTLGMFGMSIYCVFLLSTRFLLYTPRPTSPRGVDMPPVGPPRTPRHFLRLPSVKGWRRAAGGTERRQPVIRKGGGEGRKRHTHTHTHTQRERERERCSD